MNKILNDFFLISLLHRSRSLLMDDDSCDDPQTDYKGFNTGNVIGLEDVSFDDVFYLFNHFLDNVMKIVFPWNSIQGKRKLWLRISLVSREPS